MVMLFTDPRMLDHTPPARHPERPERLSAIVDHLRIQGWDFAEGNWEGDARQAVLALHEERYVERFERAVERAGGDLMVDTPPAREPDNPDFVLPLRGGAEAIADYIARLGYATAVVERSGR